MLIKKCQTDKKTPRYTYTSNECLRICTIPLREYPFGDPHPQGVPYEYLSLIIFFKLSLHTGKSFISRCGSYEMLPYGVPFDSLSFLYLTSGHFFDFKNLLGLSRFLTPPIFYIDGRIWCVTESVTENVTESVTETLICKFLENYSIFFSHCFWSPQKTF